MSKQNIGFLAAQERGENAFGDKNVFPADDPNEATLRMSEVRAMFELFNVKEGKAILEIDAGDNLVKVMDKADDIVDKIHDIICGNTKKVSELVDDRLFRVFKSVNEGMAAIKTRLDAIENRPQAETAGPIEEKREVATTMPLVAKKIIVIPKNAKLNTFKKEEIRPFIVNEKIGFNKDAQPPSREAVLVSEYHINSYAFKGIPMVIRKDSVIFGWKYAKDISEMIKAISRQLFAQGLDVHIMSNLKKSCFEGVYIKFKGLNLDTNWAEWIQDAINEKELEGDKEAPYED